MMVFSLNFFADSVNLASDKKHEKSETNRPLFEIKTADDASAVSVVNNSGLIHNPYKKIRLNGLLNHTAGNTVTAAAQGFGGI